MFNGRAPLGNDWTTEEGAALNDIQLILNHSNAEARCQVIIPGAMNLRQDTSATLWGSSRNLHRILTGRARKTIYFAG